MKKTAITLFMAALLTACICGCGKNDNSVAVTNNGENGVELGEYKNLEVKLGDAAVTEEQIQAEITSMLSGSPTYQTVVGRPVQDADVVNIEYVGKKDGVAFEGGTSDNYDLEIGSGTFIPGFEAGLIGANVGETRELNLTFPEEYHMPDLAGQDVVFTVKVHEIKQKLPAELSDEWVKAYTNDTIQTVDEFKTKVREQMEQALASEARSEAQSQLFDTIINNSKITVDQAKVDAEKEKFIGIYEQYAQQYGLTMQEFYDATGLSEDQLREQAEVTVKQNMVIDAIAEKEGIEITDADRQEFADHFQMSVEDLKSTLGDEDFEANVKANVIANFVYDNAKKN